MLKEKHVCMHACMHDQAWLKTMHVHMYALICAPSLSLSRAHAEHFSESDLQILEIAAANHEAAASK